MADVLATHQSESGATSDRRAASGRAVRVPDAVARELFELEERSRELELRLRERIETDYIREVELRAVQRDLEVKIAYVARLETTKGELHRQAHELFEARGYLERTLAASEARVAELGALCAAIQRQRSYRAAQRVARLLRLPIRVLRRLRRALAS